MKSKSITNSSQGSLLEKPERSRILALDAFIEGRLPLIEERFQQLGSPNLRGASQDELKFVGFRLSYLYSAFESLFKRISQDFLRFSPVTRRPILERMRMDLGSTRPAVIDAESFEKLDTLARFRHWLFQTELQLQEEDVAPVLRKALELRAIYRPQLQAFVAFLRRVR
jgi:hypothetical protein